jgi:hypothetical protein
VRQTEFLVAAVHHASSVPREFSVFAIAAHGLPGQAVSGRTRAGGGLSETRQNPLGKRVLTQRVDTSRADPARPWRLRIAQRIG